MTDLTVKEKAKLYNLAVEIAELAKLRDFELDEEDMQGGIMVSDYSRTITLKVKFSEPENKSKIIEVA